MVGILLRFRVNEVAFTADIEKAFLNVQLDRHDRDYTKFLWLSNPDDPESAFNTYRFKVVLFGATCSPFLLNAVVKTHLESNPGDASADLTMNTYMDNVISGVRSQSMSPESVSQSAINYYSVANDVMQKGGFKLRMWATNDPMLRQIAQNDGNNDPANSVNVVGLRWLTNNDMLTYAGDSNPNTSVLPTKREIVRTTSSLFDPLGLLAPVHVQAKLFIQQLWQENKQWDELLTDDLSPKWTSIRHELESAKDIVFRRPYFNGHSNSDYELHVFADASTRAYGAVTYLKRGNETAIVMAKTRIKPPKDMTLPRMELMAALIGARFAKFVTRELSNINLTKRVLWCDSQIVIHWLQSDKQLPIFVENRVKEIRATNFDQIKYCNTKDNPADLLTRGISAKELAQSELWWKGPFWLPTGDWPICELFDMDVLSRNAESCDTHTLCVNDVSPATDTVLHTTTVTAQHSAGNLQKVMDITHFSILGKLCVTAYVLRFIPKLRKCTHAPQDKYISVLELRDAKRLWINAVQSDTFACELKSIQRNTKCALVYKLKLFIDSDGIIRCGGRFQNADLQYGQKFPILLPTKHLFTLLEIAHTHSVILHSGVGATITHLSQLWT